MIFFECLCNLLFRVLNISSIGAHSGEYGAKNITFQPLLLSSSIDFLDLCMGQLSRIMTVLCSSIHRSSSIHLESFWIYSTKFDVLLAPTKFVVNQLPFEVDSSYHRKWSFKRDISSKVIASFIEPMNSSSLKI